MRAKSRRRAIGGCKRRVERQGREEWRTRNRRGEWRDMSGGIEDKEPSIEGAV
jgi:hypothetical protein